VSACRSAALRLPSWPLAHDDDDFLRALDGFTTNSM
jgi:hypothetical protein